MHRSSSLDESQGGPATRANLTHLSAISLCHNNPVLSIIKSNGAALQALDLVNTGSGVTDFFREMVFPSLKRLRIIEGHVRPRSDEMPMMELVSPL